MADKAHYVLGHLDGADVGVQPNLNGQDILIQHSDRGQRLACLLAPVAAEMDRRGDALYWRIPHDRQVDRLLTELIDLFISIRYAHPTLVQLELDLGEPGPSTSEGADGLEAAAL